LKKLLFTLLAVLFIGVLAACGGSSEDESANASTSGKDKEKTGNTSFPKTVKHEMGELTLDKKPSRIASVDIMITDYLLVLGETPIVSEGMGTKERSDVFAKYADGKDITDLGGKVNMETIVEKDPDVMLMSSDSKKTAKYDQFNKIADTAVIDFSGGVRSRLEQIADIVGKEDEAMKIIADFDGKVAEAKQAASKHADETVLFLVSNGKDFTVMNPKDFPVYYEEIGLKPVKNLPTEEKGRIGIEALSELNPDHIFIAENRRKMNGDDRLGLIRVWQENPVWKSLNAVKSEHVYPVDTLVGDTFFLGQLAGVEAVIENLGK